jgi:hypothetical protein
MRETNVIFIEPVGCLGFETAEQLALPIVVWQDEPFGFVTDGEWDVFQSGFVRRRACGLSLRFRARRNADEAAGHDREKAESRASDDPRRATRPQHE